MDIRTRMGDLGRSVGKWCSRIWCDIRPGPEARRGGIWGSIAAAFAGVLVIAFCMGSGFGFWLDLAFCVAAAALILVVSTALVPLLLTILRKLPRLASGFVVGSIAIFLLGFLPVGVMLGPAVCISSAFLGAAIASLRPRHFNGAAVKKKIIIVGLFILAIAAIAGQVFFLAYDGSAEEPVKAHLKAPDPQPLSASDPSKPGPFKVEVIHYGARGGNPRRPEYNNAEISTGTVDASKFFADFKGWKRNLRKRFWGYDLDKLPLNATVWLPQGSGPFPLVLIVHGNHGMAEYSDPGYGYLGDLLASRGFIMASVDENFLNGWIVGLPNEYAVRGWMLLEHLKLWRRWSEDKRNPLGTAIDFDRIALIGHSRGGEAAATAALFNRMSHCPEDATIRFDYNFPIQSVVAIAPADGQYKPAGQPRFVENVNYFTIQGANDSDVSSFLGSRQFDRVRYASGGDWFKSELYIRKANHGQFNTVWGRSDFGYPLGWFLNLRPLMDPEDQRRIAGIYIAAFLEDTLHGRREYRPLFRDYRTISAWLPETVYINRYEDADFRLIADFSEDPDVTTTTLAGGRIDASDLSVWREARIPFRRGDREYNGVFLGWNRRDENGKEDPKIKPAYEITLPETAASAWNLQGSSALVLSVAALEEDAPLLDGKQPKSDEKKEEDVKKERGSPDFAVEFETADGVVVSQPLSRFGAVPPPVKVRFTKLQMLDNRVYQKASEPVFQTIRVPLSPVSGQKVFDVKKLRKIRLRFDRTVDSKILLSKIGLE